MGAAHKINDKRTLQVLVPFNALSPMHFNEVAQKTVVEEIRAGRLVFKEGERDNQSVYLLEGEISLVSGNEIVGTVSAGSDASRHPLAHQQPRQVTARAKSNLVVARVDSSLLDIMLTWDQSSGYEVSDIDDNDDDDWMTRILQSQAFLKLPPSNIQRLLMRVESVPVSSGEVIIRQGSEGDFFYIIKNGRCMVSRRPSANAKEVKLAELGDGDAFGEDALVSDAKRNATITMITDGVLMRLAKQDFVELLKEPLLNKLSYADAAALVKKGAIWLDVRLPGEFENVHIPDSRNIPLSALRLEANGLNAGSKYIVCCDTSRRSASAAFVLSQRGFEVYVLNEGLGGVPAEALVGTAATVAEPTSADVVALKPATEVVPAPELIAAPNATEVAALEDRIQSLQGDKETMTSAQAQLAARVSDLQEELERVREEAREQILELEQNLAESRKDISVAQNKLLAMKDDAKDEAQQADKVVRAQHEKLESELARHQAHEEQLQAELTALQIRFSELETAHQSSLQAAAGAEAAHAKFQEQIEALQAKASQADERLAQIEQLEAALQQANQQGTQEQADQLRRVGELEAALQVATDALERAQRQAEQQQTDLNATYHQALEEVQSTAAQQLAELHAQLERAEAERTELEAHLVAASESLTQTQQTEQQQRAAFQTQLESLTAELAQVNVQAETAAGELAALRESQAAGLAEALADVEQLRAELTAAKAAQAKSAEEYTVLLSRQDAAAREHSEMQAALTQAQKRVQELHADAGEQVQNLESALVGVREQLAAAQQEQTSLAVTHDRLSHEHEQREAELAAARGQLEVLSTEREQLESEQTEVLAKLTVAESRVSALEQDAEARAESASGLQQQLDDAQRERESAQQSAHSLQSDYADAQAALTEAKAQLELMQTQQADAASSHEEQLQSLAQLREELHTMQAQLRAADASRNEIEVRLTEMTAAANDAQQQLKQAKSEQQQLVSEAEQRGRAALEAQLETLKSELENARAALARQLSERDNLEQATQAEYSTEQAQQLEALAQLQEALKDTERALLEARAGEQSVATQLSKVRADAVSQQQALVAELEQLRMATTADIVATQQQLLQVEEELKSARRLSAGGPASEELDKLRLLLDGAREEASQARADAEQWREHALAETAAPKQQNTDELAALRVQLADVECRIEEATQLRDTAQQEVAQLRSERHAQQLRQSMQDTPADSTATHRERPARRGGLWMGLAAGVLLGVVGAGGVLWFGPSTPVPGPTNPVTAPQPATSAQPDAAAPVVESVKAAAGAPAVTKGESAAVPVTKQREFRDSLSDGSKGPILIEIPAASYSMGSGISSLDFDERPKHAVELRRFAIGKFEVTFDEYDAFARATGRPMPDDKGWGRGQRPVINVSWEESLTYTRWLSEQTGKRYRLPTEAEWEYAAGGSARTLYWWGNSPGENRANCFNCGSEWDAHLSAPVGSFAANPLGLHDSSGNVAEWVQDCYQPSYEGAPSDGSAWNTVGCTRHVTRGGGFNSPANTLRLTKRDQQLASMRADDLGFRVVRDY